jgi:hypothetical protein
MDKMVENGCFPHLAHATRFERRFKGVRAEGTEGHGEKAESCGNADTQSGHRDHFE